MIDAATDQVKFQDLMADYDWLKGCVIHNYPRSLRTHGFLLLLGFETHPTLSHKLMRMGVGHIEPPIAIASFLCQREITVCFYLSSKSKEFKV